MNWDHIRLFYALDRLEGEKCMTGNLDKARYLANPGPEIKPTLQYLLHVKLT